MINNTYNPFRFGEMVGDRFFTDRETEAQDIIHTIDSGQNLVLISPRRYGKSSLIAKVLTLVKYEAVVIDLELVNTELELANLLIRKLLANHPFEKLKQVLKDFKVKPAINIDPNNGELSVSYIAGETDIRQYCTDAFELANKLAGKQRKVVVMDEFQEIRRIEPGLERRLRSIFQKHQQVCYIFIGSNRHMITDIFQNSNNPFYKFGRHITLGRIVPDLFAKYLHTGFNRLKLNAKISASIVSNILETTKGHPYYTQQLAYEVFVLLSKGEPANNIIDQAILAIIKGHNAEFTQWWQERNNTERKILTGLVDGKDTYGSKKFLDHYELKATSTVMTSLRKLYDKCIVEIDEDRTYFIEDLFFQEWIRYRRKMM